MYQDLNQQAYGSCRKEKADNVGYVKKYFFNLKNYFAGTSVYPEDVDSKNDDCCYKKTIFYKIQRKTAMRKERDSVCLVCYYTARAGIPTPYRVNRKENTIIFI